MPVINPQTGAELLQYQASIVPSNLDNARANLEDFVYNGLAARYISLWTNTNSGAGSSVSINTTSTADHPGILEIRAGTAVTGASLVASAFPASQIILPTGRWELRQMSFLSALSTAAVAYTARFGLGDQTVSSDVTDGVYFEYTHSLNGGNWTCCTASNSVRTKVDSLVPADTNWHEFAILGTADDEAAFYIDGVLVATIAATMPSGAARATSIAVGQMLKSAGAVTRSLFVDYIYYGYSYRVAR
jgi:hypothetical protein